MRETKESVTRSSHKAISIFLCGNDAGQNGGHDVVKVLKGRTKGGEAKSFSHKQKSNVNQYYVFPQRNSEESFLSGTK